MHEIYYECTVDQALIKEAAVLETVSAVIDLLGFKNKISLSLILCSDEEIKEVNHDTRNKDKATDVLSFPMQGEDEFITITPQHIGDIMISFDTLVRQASVLGHTNMDEFIRLLIHGMLHIKGYDHETEQESILMQQEEDRISLLLEEQGIAKENLI